MKTTVIITILVLIILAPYPFPLSTKIQETVSPDASEKAIFYWKGTGLIGYFIPSNPWVYLEIENKKENTKNYYDIWADTPCDGVKRLKKYVSWEFDVCDDNENTL